MKFYITDRCIGCGSCVSNCHGRCISRTDGKMVIDQDRCLSCGSCMTACPREAILEVGDTYEHPAHDPVVMDADIVVVGSGGAGLVAAARIAAISDKKVVVLEKMPYIGGGMNFAADWRIYGSRWQNERGIPNLMQEKIQAAMDATNWQLDNKLVYQAYANTGKFFDWFETLVPEATFKETLYVFDIPHGGQINPFPTDESGRTTKCGLFASKALQKFCKEKNVPILTRHKVVDFELTDGRISAVIAQEPGGIVKVTCKSVILSSGSWIANKELLEKYCPEFASIPLQREAHTSLAYTGDGIPLAEKAGAYVDYSSLCLRLMGPMAMAPGAAGVIGRSPACLYVNKNGKRWICEGSHIRLDNAFGLAHILVQQPDAVSYTLFERSMVDRLYKQLDGKPLMGKADDQPQHPVPIPDDYGCQLDILAEPDGEKKLMARMMGGAGGPGGPGGPPGGGGGPGPGGGGKTFFVGNTIEELAREAGIDPVGLRKTIEDYNEMCREGFDREFFKAGEDLIPFGEGPFYAVKGELATDGAFGGIQVDADTRAYADPRSKTVVPGLYVPGDFAASRFLNYNGVKVQVLNDLAWAISSGFSAAEAAVADLDG